MSHHLSVDVEATSFHGLSAVRLRSASLDALVLTGKGADLLSLRCRTTGTEMLDRVPDPEHRIQHFKANGAVGYGGCFLGGWPSLLPSRARWADGAIGPTECGEAATVPWESRDLVANGRRRLHCSTVLSRSGLRTERSFYFDRSGRRLHIDARVTNLANRTLEFNWTEHPTFGSDLLEGSFELLLPGCDVYDPHHGDCIDRPVDGGSLVGGNSALRSWRVAARSPDTFRTLKRINLPWVAVYNPARGVGVQLRWDTNLLPHAWYWQSTRTDQRALAIEPSNSYLTELAASSDAAMSLTLAPNESIQTRFSLQLIDARAARRLQRALCLETSADVSAGPAEVVQAGRA